MAFSQQLRICRCIVVACILSAGFRTTVASETFDLNSDKARLEINDIENTLDAMEERQRRWFVLAGIVNVYPRLERERLIRNVLDPAIRTLAPGYRGTRTVSDMRDEHLLWPPQIAVGRVLSDRFALSMHVGYGAGTVRTRKRNPSILLGIPLHSDVRIYRYAVYVGLDLDYYPWGMVEFKKYPNWGARLQAAKPTLGVRHTWTWAGFTTRIRLGLGPFKSPVRITITDSWALPNITFVAGVDIPINRRSALIVNAGYSFFRRERQDFEGAAFTLGWRYMF